MNQEVDSKDSVTH